MSEELKMNRERIQQVIDNGGECKTRGGLDARVFMFADMNRTYKVLGAVRRIDGDGTWLLQKWTADGRCSVDGWSQHDLILPRMVAFERWVTQIKNQRDRSYSYLSMQDAKEFMRHDCIAIHKCTYYTDGSTPDVETVWRRGEGD